MDYSEQFIAVLRNKLQLLASTYFAEAINSAKEALRNPRTAGNAAKALATMTAAKPLLQKYLSDIPAADAVRVYENAKAFVQSVEQEAQQ